mmetsp:Transcript_16745/g.42038  ORF Transcript_16745/g.42038 Transcript_16745/m.42038 type:complete len:252 (+) Transcript_16745:1967-2722(+)
MTSTHPPSFFSTAFTPSLLAFSTSSLPAFASTQQESRSRQMSTSSTCAGKNTSATSARRSEKNRLSRMLLPTPFPPFAEEGERKIERRADVHSFAAIFATFFTLLFHSPAWIGPLFFVQADKDEASLHACFICSSVLVEPHLRTNATTTLAYCTTSSTLARVDVGRRWASASRCSSPHTSSASLAPCSATVRTCLMTSARPSKYSPLSTSNSDTTKPPMAPRKSSIVLAADRPTNRPTDRPTLFYLGLVVK